MILIHSLVFIYLYIIKKQKSFLCTHGLTDIGFFNPHYSEIQPCTCTLENKSEFDTTFKTFIIVKFYLIQCPLAVFNLIKQTITLCLYQTDFLLRIRYS